MSLFCKKRLADKAKAWADTFCTRQGSTLIFKTFPNGDPVNTDGAYHPSAPQDGPLNDAIYFISFIVGGCPHAATPLSDLFLDLEDFLREQYDPTSTPLHFKLEQEDTIALMHFSFLFLAKSWPLHHPGNQDSIPHHVQRVVAEVIVNFMTTALQITADNPSQHTVLLESAVDCVEALPISPHIKAGTKDSLRHLPSPNDDTS